LPREEWRRSRQGKKVAGRRCGKSIEAKPSFGQIKPREVAWAALPDNPERRLATGSVHPRGTPRLGPHPLYPRPQRADTAATRLPFWRPLLATCRDGREEVLDGAARRSTSLIRCCRSGHPHHCCARGQQRDHNGGGSGDRAVHPRPTLLQPEGCVARALCVRDRARQG